MGLDMYLDQRKRVGMFDENKKDYVESAKITVEKTFTDGTKSTEEIEVPRMHSSITMRVPVAYWRKANMLHRWFLSAAEAKEDNCEPLDITGKQIQELVQLCRDVLADHSKAKDLLPTCAGFFFGDTEYDEYYFECLEETVNMLKDLDPDAWYVYQASW